MVDYIDKSDRITPRCGSSGDKPASPGSISEYWIDTDTDSVWKSKLVAGTGLVWVDIVKADVVLDKATDYTITGDEASGEITIDVDSSSGDVTITLPPALGYQYRFLNVCKIDSSVNTVTIDGNGTETINNSLLLVMSIQDTNMRLQSNGTNYRIR